MSRKSIAEIADVQPDCRNDPGVVREPAAEWVHIDELDPWERNPRKNDEAAPKLAKLIVKLGFGSAMLAWIDPETGRNQIIGGHTRKKAVQLLQRKLPECNVKQRAKWHPDAIRTAETGMVPVRVRTDLTAAQAHQLAVTDNKSNEWAEWDAELLPDVLSEFSLPDVEDLGFDPKKLDRMADDLYGLGDFSEKEVKIDTSFQVVITVESEEEQLAVIEWAQGMDYKCRALI
jgi:hypothetical protein